MSWSRLNYVPLYPATNSTLPRHGTQWNILTGLYVLMNFFKNLCHFKRIMSQLYSEKNEGMQRKSRKLQIKTASSFNRVRNSKCSTVPRSPLLISLNNQDCVGHGWCRLVWLNLYVKRGRKMQDGYKRSRFSTNISLYLGNDTR